MTVVLGLPRGDLTDDDIGLLETIAEVTQSDARAGCAMIYAYYRDFDRAERTPRAFLYLHLGLLAGVALREVGGVQ